MPALRLVLGVCFFTAAFAFVVASLHPREYCDTADGITMRAAFIVMGCKPRLGGTERGR